MIRQPTSIILPGEAERYAKSTIGDMSTAVGRCCWAVCVWSMVWAAGSCTIGTEWRETAVFLCRSALQRRRHRGLRQPPAQYQLNREQWL